MIETTCRGALDRTLGARSLPEGCFTRKKKCNQEWELGALFIPSLNVIWGGSLGTSSRKAWESLSCHNWLRKVLLSDCLPLSVFIWINLLISKLVHLPSWQSHRNFFLYSSLLFLMYKVSELIQLWDLGKVTPNFYDPQCWAQYVKLCRLCPAYCRGCHRHRPY